MLIFTESTQTLSEVKDLFQQHYRSIYTSFFEAFTQLDTCKLKGKGNREDVDLFLHIFDKILVFLPEMIERKWQINSIVFIFTKLLNHGNSFFIRNESMRLFILFYQIIGEHTIREYTQIELIYASLVPGVVVDLFNNSLNPLESHLPEYYEQKRNCGVFPVTNEPFYVDTSEQSHPSPVFSGPSSGSTYPGQQSPASIQYQVDSKLEYTRCLLNYTISQCNKVRWNQDDFKRQTRAFEFLMASFARIYMPNIFPQLAIPITVDRNHWRSLNIGTIISVYKPPEPVALNKYRADPAPYLSTLGKQNILCSLQSIVIQWFVKYFVDQSKCQTDSSYTGSSLNTGTLTSHSGGAESTLTSKHSSASLLAASMSSLTTATLPLSSSPFHSKVPPSATDIDENEARLMYNLVNTKHFYVDLLMSLFRLSFCLPFTDECSESMRSALRLIRQWTERQQHDSAFFPLFLAEPRSGSSSSSGSRDILPQNNVCAGFMNFLKVFIVTSSNSFLPEIPVSFIDRQVDICKRVINIYRFMVMKIDMDKPVWEMLIQTLIDVTGCIMQPMRSEDSLGSRLAPAYFQVVSESECF